MDMVQFPSPVGIVEVDAKGFSHNPAMFPMLDPTLDLE